ncbi:dnaA protein helix-turn-helix [Malonomonas rubra DSM 5091]|uniref:DnaA protein helix-turn-helix n=1 Tax=Malonomonas rubra DSM 5091 TaxID=1122189 RepID=A0A1M6GGG9_MALRU|nr:transposase [Malonomonas rubra]SHJ08998.1 dnaA protein helix-turn-helix [Malonomonas rubra DSM 5091]
MARKPRLHFPGAVYHVTLHGNGNQQIFSDDTDRTRFLLLIQEGIEKFGHKVYAYCLHPSYLQLVIEVDETPLSRIMQQLGFRYTRWYNDYHQQNGHLFQGRYKAILIDPEVHLLNLVREVHLAPVRNGEESDPMRFAWSSHRAYCGREKVIWLSTDRPMLQIEETGIKALMRFHSYVNEGSQQEATEDFTRGSAYDPRVLGSDDFVRGVFKLSRQKYKPKVNPEKVQRIVLERYKLTEDELAAPGKNRHCAEARAYLAWLYLETGCDTLTALGEQLGRDVSSLSSAVRRLQLKAKKDEKTADRFQKLMNRIRR